MRENEREREREREREGERERESEREKTIAMTRQVSTHWRTHIRTNLDFDSSLRFNLWSKEVAGGVGCQQFLVDVVHQSRNLRHGGKRGDILGGGGCKMYESVSVSVYV